MRAISTDAFTEALQSIRTVRVRPDVQLDEAPAPSRLAPDACALTVDPLDPDDDAYTGRFVLLHDPDGHDEWGGPFRAVVFAKARIEREVVHDPLLTEVGWSWVNECLNQHDLAVTNLGGTVTLSSGTGFGTLVDRVDEDSIEIRASWTPLQDPGEMDRHVQAWIDLIAQMAGLPIISDDVTPVGRRARS